MGDNSMIMSSFHTRKLSTSSCMTTPGTRAALAISRMKNYSIVRPLRAAEDCVMRKVSWHGESCCPALVSCANRKTESNNQGGTRFKKKMENWGLRQAQRTKGISPLGKQEPTYFSPLQTPGEAGDDPSPLYCLR
eukprot:4182717-Amphidinium_carterae.1